MPGDRIRSHDVHLIITALHNHARDNRTVVEKTPMRTRVEDQLARDADRCDELAERLEAGDPSCIATALDDLTP